MSDFRSKFVLPSRYNKQPSLWVEYAELAAKYKPVDLGIGAPDFPPPQYVKDALQQVAASNDNRINQYTRGAGHPRLSFALSKLYSQVIGREINPYTEILITLGGYHAIFYSIMGVIESGDEVIVMEPFFEAFEHNIRTAGGIPRFTPLKLRENIEGIPTSDDWILDYEHLESLFNEKTKMIIVNTPHNPLGKVFTYEELSYIAELCKKWNVICLVDEVYEWLTFDSKKHIKMASLPGMWDRTLSLSSAGKIFGVTGWKVGWVYGPSYLISNLQLVHFNCVRAGNTFLQEVAAICFEQESTRLGSNDSYFVSLPKQCEVKRDYLFKQLSEAGFKPILPSGGYFMVANWSHLEKSIDLSEEKDKYKDFQFTKWMTKNVGLQAIPMSPFYSENHKFMGENLVRFCFVKTDGYLNQAGEVIKNWKTKFTNDN